jgi:hypothetical protein
MGSSLETEASVGVIESVPDFRSLSVRDLLAARELYHWQLANRPHVVGTAIGLYLIRHDDPWPDAARRSVARRGGNKGERTFENSEVRPYSWPCVLAFVDDWAEEREFRAGGRLHPEDFVPKTLYLPDGRAVPVCVVRVEPAEPLPMPASAPLWPAGVAGGGFPLSVDSQDVERRASAGCLVTDGHTLFVLTNRHVSGDVGERISAQTRSGFAEIGTSSRHQITRRPFNDVYSTFAGANTYLNVDVGLVELDDANDWTASVYGLGEVGELADLNESNIGLQLIDRPVKAYGAASGHLDGTIKALFYRYKSVGGYDYVADLLIAPSAVGRSTQPGDSGTVWHLSVTDEHGAESLHPLAVEWGGQTFQEGEVRRNFTLATNLSNICRLLDVEVVLTHNVAARPYWGATGHYSIAATAVSGVQEPKLGPFLRANAASISFDRGTLAAGDLSDVLAHADLVPLADVADVVWKKTPRATPGGRDDAPNSGPEHPTHYCDIDEPGADGRTLRQRCVEDPHNVAIDVWQRYYDENHHTAPAERGCLPFRVWQFYDAMVGLVAAGDHAGYLCAAGLVAHYVGDACQPLHGSYLADGFKDQATDHVTSGGHVVKVWPGKGVHSAFETNMIDAHATELFVGIDDALRAPGRRLPRISSGHDAAVATVRLMDRTAQTLPPRTLIETYISLGGGTSKKVIDGLWDAFQDQTASVMADGIRVLRHIWIAAWRAGGGAAAPKAELVAIAPKAIIARYRDREFVPSLDLDHIGAVLR